MSGMAGGMLSAGVALFAVAALSPPATPVQTLFTARCNRCHDLPELREYSHEDWSWVIGQMSYNARLSKAEATALLHWLQSNGTPPNR